MQGEEKVSIIIPTFNRCDVLGRCLLALDKQDYPLSLIELIVVDDGSDEGTASLCNSIIPRLSVRVRYLRQENKGRSAARNTGIRTADGEIIILLGDDIIADSRLITEHVKYQQRFTMTAVVGYITWDSGLEMTPFRQCLGKGILLPFDNKCGLEREKLDYHYAYASNISIRRDTIQNILFDEEFKGYGFEDIEWGYRLQQSGIGFRLNRNAIGYHHHDIDFISYCERMFEAGQAKALFYYKHPELNMKSSYIKEAIRWVVRWLKNGYRGILLKAPKLVDALSLIGAKINLEKCYRSVLDYHFHRGFRTALRTGENEKRRF